MVKSTFYITLFFLFPILLFAQNKDNILTPEEFEQGWELLFDGNSLKSWKVYNGDTPSTLYINDNAIYCDGTSEEGDLITIEMFEDFDFKFQWRIPNKGNSGVIYRVREGGQWKKAYLTGAEYQVYGEEENYSKTSVGSLYDVYPPSTEKKIKPAMKWNDGRIRISNGFITHWVNEVIVMQCKIDSEDWKSKIAESK